jgi:predicted Zn-dependent peptidase
MKHIVTEHKLASGARGLVVNVPGSAIVNIVIRFNAGFQFTNHDRYEVPHVAEHLIGCGTKRYPGPNEFKVEIQKNGAYRNAYTSADTNGYVIECAQFELDRIFDLLEEYIARPLFPSEAFATEVSNVREELTRNTTQHGTVCAMALAEQSFPHESLNYETRIQQLDSLRHEHILEHYQTTHTSQNARFYVAGSFEDKGASIAKRLERIFSALNRGQRLEPLRRPGRGLDQPVVTKRDIKQIYYRIAAFSGEYPRPLRNALTLLRMTLTGGFQSRIYGEARRRGLAYHISSSAYAGLGESEFGFEGYVTPQNIAPLFELVAQQYRAVRDGELTESELDAAKDLLVGSSLRGHQTAGDMLNWYLAPYDQEGIILDYDQYHEELRRVTLEQVREVANDIMKPGAHAASLLGDLSVNQADEYMALLEPFWSKR